MRTHDFLARLTAVLLMVPVTSNAWGPVGHRVIGRAAFELLDGPVRIQVMDILRIDEADAAADALDAACNWPDEVRPTPEWAWSAPLHYVNLPRYSPHYDRQRDCPDGLCVTEGVLRFASVLTHPASDGEQSWQALAFLCHFVGDLHQPLHAGFRDDRGANLVEVIYRDEESNLHEWWDSVLVRNRVADEDRHVEATAAAARKLSTTPWNPGEVVRWTEESHHLALEAAYPSQSVIDERFAARSWTIIERQWSRAAARLARILNTALGHGDLAPERTNEERPTHLPADG